MRTGHLDVSISALLEAPGAKNYLGLTGSDGFEWGVGRAGQYDPHAHAVFYDVLYCPAGMRVAVDPHGPTRCRLFVAAPGCFFDPLELTDFWFMKFLGTAPPEPPTLPDKLLAPPANQPTGAQYIALDTGSISVSFAAWDGSQAGYARLTASIDGGIGSLTVAINDSRSFTVHA